MTVEQALRELFPEARVGAAVADADPLGLHPAERAGIAGAAAVRQREFAAGRLLLRRLLPELGGAPLLPGPDRAPLWPPGWTGSLAHGGGRVVAVLVQEGAVGVDVEPAEALPEGVAERVLLPSEAAWARGRPAWAGRVPFCLKEAFYKAQRTLGGPFLDFAEVELEPGEGEARLLRPRPARLGWRLAEGLILAGARLDALRDP